MKRSEIRARRASQPQSAFPPTPATCETAPRQQAIAHGGTNGARRLAGQHPNHDDALRNYAGLLNAMGKTGAEIHATLTSTT
jgi:hypothetical protein